MDVEDVKADIVHQEGLIVSHKRTLRVLEQQAARFGMHTPPYIQIEIEDLTEKIEQCQWMIGNLTQQLAAWKPQREAMATPILETPAQPLTGTTPATQVASPSRTNPLSVTPAIQQTARLKPAAAPIPSRISQSTRHVRLTALRHRWVWITGFLMIVVVSVAVWFVGRDPPLRILGGHTDSVYAVAWSPDGETLATASADTTVRLWSADGAFLKKLTLHSERITSVSWSPDGTIIATASLDKTARLWNVNGTFLREFTGYPGGVLSVAWSPDGTTLASGGGETVQLWGNHDAFLKELTDDASVTVYSVAWSPDSTILASGSLDRTVRLWNANGTLRTKLTGHAGPVTSVTWSPDGTTLASADGETVRLWNADGTFLKELAEPTKRVTSVAWSPDGTTLASAGDKTVRLWNADGTFLKELTGHTERVTFVAWSPDGTTLASASLDKTVRLWRVR